MLFNRKRGVNHIFCDCCGDNVKAAYPCKFMYHDGVEVNFNICLDCMENGTLEINLSRKRLVGKMLNRLTNNNKWRRRVN